MGQLAARVRAKYPGQYDDLDDADLERRVLARHPEYADLADSRTTTASAPSFKVPFGWNEYELGPALDMGGRALGAAAGLAGDVLTQARRPFDMAAREVSSAIGAGDPNTWLDERGLPAHPTSGTLALEALIPERDGDRGRTGAVDVLAGLFEGQRALAAKLPGIGPAISRAAPPGSIAAQVRENPIAQAVSVASPLGLAMNVPKWFDEQRARGVPGAELAEDLVRPVVDLPLQVGTDPLSVTGASAAGRALLGAKAGAAAGPTLAGIDQGLASLAATLAAAGGVERGAEAGRQALKGDFGKAAVSGEEALLSAAMAVLGMRGAHEIAARRRTAKVDTGPAYPLDPTATPAEASAASEAIAARSAAEAATRAESEAAFGRAAERLRAEGLAAAEPRPAAPQTPVLGKEMRVAATREARKAYEALAATEATTDVPPRAVTALRGRLLELWREEGAAKEPARETTTPDDVARGTEADRKFLRTLEPAFDATARLPVVGKELAGRARAFNDTWEKRLGDWSSRTARALAQLGRTPTEVDAALEGQGVRRYLDGLAPLDTVPEPLRPAAETLRAIDQEIASEAVRTGVIKASDVIAEGHFPHLPTPEVAERFTPEAKARDLAQREGITLEAARAKLAEPGSQLVGGTRSGRRAVSEHVRGEGGAKLQEGEYRTDGGVLFEHVREMSRRIAEAEHLGLDGELATNLVNRLPKDSPDRHFGLKFMDRLRDVEPQGTGHRLSSYIRSWQSAAGLALSPVTQITTLGNTAAEAGVRSTLRGLGDTFLRDVKGADGAPIPWRRPFRRLTESFRDARLDAEAQGSLFAGTAERLVEFYTNQATRQGGAAGRFARGAANVPWVRWTGNVDEMQRVVATQTAQFAVPDAVASARRGNRSAMRQLERWGIDPKAETVTPEMIQTAAKRISDRSQFRVGVGELPLWASSPWGKVAFQFQSFGYKHFQMLRWAGQEAARGNLKPATTLLVAGSALGYLNSTVRNALRLKGFDEPSEEGFATILKDMGPAFTGRKHFAPTSPEGVLLAAIEGVGAAGGFGIMQTMAERFSEGDPAKMALGATGSDVVAASRVLPPLYAAHAAARERAAARAAGDETGVAAAERKEADEQGKAGKALARFVAGALPQTPIISPNEIVREHTADVPPANPGGYGRLRDLLAGEPSGPPPAPAGYRGNVDLARRPIVQNQDKSISTVLSASFNLDGKEVLLPLIADGRVLTEDEAVAEYRRTGKHLGVFGTQAEADAAAQAIHRQQEQYVAWANSRRGAAQRLLAAREEKKGVVERREGISPPKPPAPLAGRAAKAEAATQREKAKLELQEAIRRGASDDELDEIRMKWWALGAKISAKALEALRTGTYTDPEEDEEP